MSGDTLKSDLKKVLEEATQSIKDIDNPSAAIAKEAKSQLAA